MTTAGGPLAQQGPPRERAERELGRVLTRLAALGPSRLSRRSEGPQGHPEGAAPADLVRPVLQHLAGAAAELEREPVRTVPVLAERALGDQLAVLGADLLTAADAALADPARAPAASAALEAAAEELAALRRAL